MTTDNNAHFHQVLCPKCKKPIDLNTAWVRSVDRLNFCSKECGYAFPVSPATADKPLDPATMPHDHDDAERLKAAVIALYKAGVWLCPALPMGEQIRLWTELRESAGIAPGTATNAGVAPAPAPGGGKEESK